MSEENQAVENEGLIDEGIKEVKNMISHLQNNQGFHKTTLLWSVFKVGRKNME
jgi:hypothetical protein